MSHARKGQLVTCESGNWVSPIRRHRIGFVRCFGETFRGTLNRAFGPMARLLGSLARRSLGKNSVSPPYDIECLPHGTRDRIPPASSWSL